MNTTEELYVTTLRAITPDELVAAHDSLNPEHLAVLLDREWVLYSIRDSLDTYHLLADIDSVLEGNRELEDMPDALVIARPFKVAILAIDIASQAGDGSEDQWTTAARDAAQHVLDTLMVCTVGDFHSRQQGDLSQSAMA